MAPGPVMEIDAKTIATVLMATLGGGSAGWGSATVQMEVQLARQQVQIDNMRETIISRIAEHKVDLAAVEENVKERIDNEVVHARERYALMERRMDAVEGRLK